MVTRRSLLILALAMALLVAFGGLQSSGSTPVLYENHFETEADLADWDVLQATAHGLVPGASPCDPAGSNVLWMYGFENTWCTAYYGGGEAWDNYCFRVCARVSSNVWEYINVFFRVQEVGGAFYGIRNGYLLHLRHYQDNIELQKIVDGGGIPLATIPYDFVPGTWYGIVVRAGSELDPDSVKVYINEDFTGSDMLMISLTDDTFSSGSIAIGCVSSGGYDATIDGWFDEVRVKTLDSGPSSVAAAPWGRIKALYR